MSHARDRDVLLVEDDHAIREALLDVLVAAGFRVQCAGNGVEALAELRSSTPAVILLDLMMPVMDGWQLRRELQRQPRLADIPVVVISADHRLDEKVATLDVAGFLRKPFDVGALLATVNRYCRETAA